MKNIKYLDWYRSEVGQIGRLKTAKVLSEDQANYVLDALNEVARMQSNNARKRNRYTVTKFANVLGAALTAVGAGVSISTTEPIFRWLTVLASVVTVVASAMRIEYASDPLEWAHFRKWCIKYRVLIREFLNLTGRFECYENQNLAFKMFVGEFDTLLPIEAEQLFELAAKVPAGLQRDTNGHIHQHA